MDGENNGGQEATQDSQGQAQESQQQEGVQAGQEVTDLNNGQRTWFWGHFYEDGEVVLTPTSTPDLSRAFRALGRICAICKDQRASRRH